MNTIKHKNTEEFKSKRKYIDYDKINQKKVIELS